MPGTADPGRERRASSDDSSIGTTLSKMRVYILAMIILILSSSAGPSWAGPDEAEAEKLSNDRPDGPSQMPPASSKTKEALDGFDRFARRGAWKRATKALYAIPEAQATR